MQHSLNTRFETGRPLSPRLKSGKNIRLFKNPILEKFTYVHPLVPISLWGPILTICFLKSLHSLSLPYATALAAVGFFFWTLAEYTLHRFVFHFDARTPMQKRIAFLIHGIHHEDPEDQRRLLMPPVAALVFAAFFYALFWIVLGSVSANPFFAGFIVGYLCYDYIHFATHFVRPKSKVLMKLKQTHMKHHFVTPNRLYGVSNPLWDHVFKTF